MLDKDGEENKKQYSQQQNHALNNEQNRKDTHMDECSTSRVHKDVLQCMTSLSLLDLSFCC